MERLRLILTTQNIIGFTIGFVMIWFGLNEIFSPQDWTTFVPAIIGLYFSSSILVVIHGIVLSVCGLSLFLNYYRKVSAMIVSLMLLEIVVDLIRTSGLSDIAVRDIGLFGATFALIFDNPIIVSSTPQV